MEELNSMRQPFSFRNYIIYNNMIFIEITDDIVPNIKEKSYYININGDVYSKFLDGLMKQYLSPYGYWCVSLKLKGNIPRHCKIHRLIMLIFNHEPGCEQLVVNHLDTVKTNNNLYNMEWTTNPLNTKHAMEHGLMKSCEDHSEAILTNQQVHEICSRLAQDPHQSISALGREYNVSMETIRRIATGNGWREIRSQYDIAYELDYGRITPEMAEEMCKIFQKNKGLDFSFSYFEIISKLGLDNTEQNRKRIRRIYKREPKNFPYITCKYDY